MSLKTIPKRYLCAELGAVAGAIMGYTLGHKPAPYEELLLGATTGYILGLAWGINDNVANWFDRKKEGKLVAKIATTPSKTEDGIEEKPIGTHLESPETRE